MNSLVPFRFNEFQTSESVSDVSIREQIKRFRLTRKGWGELFGAKIPQHYINILKQRYPHLPEGITLTVRAADGKEYQTYTLDILEGYQYALYSDLPGAKEFLCKFPDFLLAIQSGQIKPAPHKGIEVVDRLNEIEGISYGQKEEAIVKLCKDTGKSRFTIYRWRNRLKEEGHLEYKYQEANRKRFEREHMPKWRLILEAINQGKKTKEIAQAFNVCTQTVCRVRKIYCNRIHETSLPHEIKGSGRGFFNDSLPEWKGFSDVLA